MRKLKSAVIAAMTVGATLFGTAQAASAGAQATATRQNCSGWDESRIVSDADSWGRVSQRVCIEYTADYEWARQRIDTRIDWPSYHRTGKDRSVRLDGLKQWVDGKNRGVHINSATCGRSSFAYDGDYGDWRMSHCRLPWRSVRVGTYWAWGKSTFEYGGQWWSLGITDEHGVRFS